MSTVTASDVVIWSADVDTPADVHRTLDNIPDLRMVKIDRAFADANGFDVIHELHDRGIKVFDDAKIIEVPTKIKKLADIHVRHPSWMINMMGNGLSSGRMEAPKPEEIEAMKLFADVCLTTDIEPCLVTVLTSKTDEMVELEYGRRRDEVVLMYLDVALQAGFTNFVCSIGELPAIRAESRFDCLQGNHPGTRLPGSDAHDQASVGTPRGIIDAGGNHLVIGRDLTGDDAVEKWKRINANLRGEAA
jgi:orotidine-5'-phosphate decarboxylase